MIRWLVEHATTILIAVLAVFVGGTISYVTLPREASPDITIPVVTVTTIYTGVSPKDIESLITIPLENELSGVKDLKKLTSTSGEGVSVVALEFEPDVVIEEALQRVRDRTSQAKSKLPADAEDSMVREIAFSDIPILIVTLAGPVDEETLKGLGETLEEKVGRIPGVLDAKLSGGLTREIRVEMDPVRLGHYGLSLGDVVGAISNENVNIPGGTIDTATSSVLLRVPGEFTDARQIESVAVKRIGDWPVFVRDLGRVVDGFEDRATYARMNGQTAVSLSVTKRPGANIVEIADLVRAETEAQSATWPEGVTFRVLSDQSEYIRAMVSELQNNIITALILVVAVILVFMGFRSSAFVAFAIPLSMLSSFLVLDALGFTLNMIVLFSLILALGMLVDNAIVVVENIYRHAEEGKSKHDAAIDGTSEVAIAVTASTATTVAAFFPLVFWTGIMGEFMGFMPKTLIIVLIASLVVAIAVLPVTMSRFMGRPARTRAPGDDDDLAPLQTGPLMRAYRWTLEFSIQHRYVSLLLMGGALIGTFVVYGVFNHGTEFFPDTDPDQVTVRIVAPDGTDVETTDRITRQVEAILAAEENVDVYVAEVGVSATGDALSGTQAVPSEARISVDFLPDRNSAHPGEKVRIEPTPDTVARLRRLVDEIPGARIQIEKQEMGPPVGAAIAVEISGDDYHDVGEFAQAFRRQIAEIAGVTDLRDDYTVGRPELALRIDRAAAKRVGVSTAEVGDTVRNAVAGTKASALRDGDDEYDIMVRVAPEFRRDLSSILDLRVPGRVDTSPDTFPVPLSTVARYDLAGGSGAIKHIDQDMVVTILGDVLEGFNENAVRAEVEALIAAADAEGFVITLSGANDEQEQAATFLGRALLIAIALILLVLVTQFDSLGMPMIILASVILSLIGVLWGLLITGTSFGIIMTGIGVISLAGVVVNNAIVLLDYVQQLRARGLDAHDALVRAGLTRFRPVMLTALTTVLGLVPMAIGVSIDFGRMRVLVGGSSAQFWGPMAIAVIFGLTFATLLTLVMVPTMYSILEDFNRAWARLGSLFSREQATGAAAKLLPLGLVLGGLAAGDAHAVTLAEAVRAAEGGNVDLALTREQTFQQEIMVGQAWSLIQPTIAAQGTYNFAQYEVTFDPAAMSPVPIESDPIVIQRKRYLTAQGTISQPLLNLPALPLLKGAYTQAQAARDEETHRRGQIVAGVARSFYLLGVARESVEVSEASLAARADGLELAQRQVEAGVAPRRAVIQAELALSRAERAVAQALEDVASAEEAFARATGMPRASTVELPELMDAPPSFEQAVDTAMAQRADLAASRARVKVSELDRTSVHLEWLPSFDATFALQYNENTGFVGESTQWFAGIHGRWTLWDGGMRVQRMRQKASEVRIAQLQAQDAEVRVQQDVRTSWESYQRAAVAYEAVQAEVKLAEESLELAQRGFSAGTVTWLELQDAEIELRQARLGLLRERMTRDLAVIDLLVATGAPPL